MEKRKFVETAKPMVSDTSVHDITFDWIVRSISKTATIADFGAGSGAFCKRLTDNGFESISCFDITENYWKIDHPLNLIDFNETINNISESPFDLIILLEVIEHVESPYHLLRQLHPLLKEDGTIIISTPNVESYPSRLIHFYNGRLRYFSEEETSNHHITPIYGWYLDNCLERIGFQIKERLFSKRSLFTSNTVKSKIVTHILRLILPFLKGDKFGENRIHIAVKGIYGKPKSI